MQSGNCIYGEKCSFAHGEQDLYPNHVMNMRGYVNDMGPRAYITDAEFARGYSADAGMRYQQDLARGYGTDASLTPRGYAADGKRFSADGPQKPYAGNNNANASAVGGGRTGSEDNAAGSSGGASATAVSGGAAQGGGKGGNFKTRICTNWQQTGTCAYGLNCNFAHGAHELRGNGEACVFVCVLFVVACPCLGKSAQAPASAHA
jgi:hypothetical protein